MLIDLSRREAIILASAALLGGYPPSVVHAMEGDEKEEALSVVAIAIDGLLGERVDSAAVIGRAVTRLLEQVPE